jgi:hypothetical protein
MLSLIRRGILKTENVNGRTSLLHGRGDHEFHCLSLGSFSFPLGPSQGVALSNYTFPSSNRMDFNLQPKVKFKFFGHLYLN